MKKILLPIILVSIWSYVWSVPPSDSTRNFFAGVSFNYINMNPKLSAYSSQNFIDGESFGWNAWSSDEINELNEFIDIRHYWLSPGLIFGGDIIPKTEKPFSLKAIAQIGYPVYEHTETQKSTDDVEYKGEQQGLDLFGGLTFDLEYRINQWSTVLRPSINYLSINSSKVDYNYLPEGSYETDYDFSTKSLYSRIDVLASYSLKKLQFFAGPGFYYYQNNSQLDIYKNSEFQQFKDEIKMDYQSVGMVDVVCAVNWKLFDRFMWSTHFRVGNDNGFETSFVYIF